MVATHTVYVPKKVNVPVPVYNYVTCKEDGGCINTTSNSVLSLTDNTFGDIGSCQAKCKSSGFRCYETKGCGDYYSTLPSDQLPKDITPNIEACKAGCKNLYKCATTGTTDYWSALSADQLPKDVTATTEACKQFFKCTCGSNCDPYFTNSTTTDPSLFTTKGECEKSKSCVAMASCTPSFWSNTNNAMTAGFFIFLGILILIMGIIAIAFKAYEYSHPM
jgi:hypothetical protein